MTDENGLLTWPNASEKVALDRRVRRHLTTLSGALALLYVVFAIAHPLTVPDVAGTLTPLAAASAAFFAGQFVYLRRGQEHRRLGHLALTLTTFVVLTNSAIHLVLTGQAQQTSNFMLISIAAGCITLLYSWYSTVMVATHATWLVLALSIPSDSWAHYGFALLSSGALSVALFVTRRRAELRILRLRDLDERHRTRLEKLVAERTRDLEASHLELENQIAESEEAVRQAQRLRMALDHAGEAVTLLDDRGNVSYGNAAFFEMMNRSPDQLLGQPFDLVKEGEADDRLVEDVAAELSKSGRWRGRYKTQWQDGRTFTRFASVNVVRSQAGESMGVVGVVRDVTREVQLEEELLHSQRMEAVGQLAGGIAHDFNNLLMVIQGYADELVSARGLSSSERDDLDAIRRAAQSAGQLTGQLLAFSRKQTLEAGVVDLNEIVRQLRELLRRVIGEDIELSTRLESCPLYVCLDTGQMEQAITNLAANARDAMPNGGHLEISTRLVHDCDRAVELTVSDSGTGIPERNLEHIFEPFFTTKEPGKGTGLGLSMVYGFVTQSGGIITAERGLESGTTFRVRLPQVAAVETRVSEPLIKSAEPTLSSATVLVVEDDTEVRRLLSHSLESAGHSVLEAENGERALELAGLHGPRVDIVVTDLVMPRMSGLKLLERLRDDCPDAGVILISGYPEHPGTLEIPHDHELLHKPFSASELIRKVSGLLTVAAP